MANSDNVIRAGLTPKLRDIPTLNACLTYISAEASEHAIKPIAYPDTSAVGPTTVIYNPPIPEFSVLLTRLSSSSDSCRKWTTELSGPSVCIVSQGMGLVKWGKEAVGELKVKEGDAFFVGANVEVTLVVEEGDMNVFRAFVEV
jgi:mannose-6-phosphate isomerase